MPIAVEMRFRDNPRPGLADSDRSLERVSIPKTRQLLRIAAEQLLLTNSNLKDSKPVQSLDQLVFTINSLEDTTGISSFGLTKAESRQIKERVLAGLGVIRHETNRDTKTELKRIYETALQAVAEACASLNQKYCSDSASPSPDSKLIAELTPFLAQKVEDLSRVLC